VRKVTGFLRLMRPANIITAIADILAGISIAGYFVGDINTMDVRPALLLVAATIGLYGGGVVFNDVFDADLDKIERPERPIPSGLINVTSATIFALVLLIAGILAASFVHSTGIFSLSGILAVFIALFAVIYDKWGKHHLLLGPLNMGLCRGLNLLLGMSIIPASLTQYWFVGFVPVIYIGAITMVSRGEVHGGKKNTLYGAVILYLLVIISIAVIAITNQRILYAGAFIVLLGWMIFPPLLRAIKNPNGPLIGKAVKAGVIALILMNAAWSAAFGFTWFALLILLLLPVSFLLAKLFAVT
jgi:4-hydroxybenzoate polyprenyltransferase